MKEAVSDFPDRHLIRQNARFGNDHTLALIDGTHLTARTVIIATGSRPSVPPPFAVSADRLILTLFLLMLAFLIGSSIRRSSLCAVAAMQALVV